MGVTTWRPRGNSGAPQINRISAPLMYPWYIIARTFVRVLYSLAGPVSDLALGTADSPEGLE